ncbi:MAG: cytochrome C oxidase subunit IV family protein [Chitinophagaceae bacterium]|nr:cytochrome C oxidase subunit IV family protein [Chitinophagaceae bacterium]MDP1810531.1 cytochrome C oxidase subunit IV family protein [Sediminibacterium sp.]MDP3129602.1 cytochrome C oxidase subunit IV family protein [Sediminibacterium sp.]
MSHTATHEEHNGGAVKEIVRVTIILSVLTAVELILGFWMMGMPLDGRLRLAIKGAIIILMLSKAFYIVGYFMHLKHEVKNLIMTIVVPLGLFIWFITAFLIDGNSFRNLRNTYDPYFKERSTIKVEKKAEAKHEEKKTETVAPVEEKKVVE